MWKVAIGATGILLVILYFAWSKIDEQAKHIQVLDDALVTVGQSYDAEKRARKSADVIVSRVTRQRDKLRVSKRNLLSDLNQMLRGNEDAKAWGSTLLPDVIGDRVLQSRDGLPDRGDNATTFPPDSERPPPLTQ